MSRDTESPADTSEVALSVFRKRPLCLGCAQAVLYAFREDIDSGRLKLGGEFDGLTSEECIAKASAYNHGADAEGMCGALQSAIVCCPDIEDTMRETFREHAGSVKCREIRQERVWSCKECVKQATLLVARHLKESE
ncbi:hypothetical protein KIPB_008555 [Kipferlia bialata]|uniref:Uncharacterized protein n=1 Tax=Kipferlia bialata TaxID=797122 RepID=A0A9K3D1T5_9EUKA|nr:hypothetical protein KIPB_008555 [Kipferlia bialata]|eukprot:g8555.t1